jgi:hypothetical protein
MRLRAPIPVLPFLLAAAVLPVQDPAKKADRELGPVGTAMADQEMEAFLALNGPGPEHGRLDFLEGRWNVVNEFTMNPGTPPQKARSVMESRWVLGKRFMQSTAKGHFMGQPVESITHIGFDRRKSVYTTIGFDTMGTYYVEAAGSYDEATETITFQGVEDDPVMDIKMDFTIKMKKLSDDHYQTELWFKFPGMEPYRVVSMDARRTGQRAGEPAGG